MILLVKGILVKAVTNIAEKIGDIQIVMICGQVVEPQAVPRSSRFATKSSTATTSTAAPTASPNGRASSCPFGFY